MGFATIDGRRVEYDLSGSGAPVIVLLNGHATPMSSWDKLMPHLAGPGTVLRYNRAGIGASDRPPQRQDGDAIVARLDALLGALSLEGPYVLVAHSLGALYANLYARRYPDRVRGMVLVEAGHPDEALQREAGLGRFARGMTRLLSLGRSSFRNDPHSEFNAVTATVAQIRDASAFPDVPLSVVTGTHRMPLVPRRAFARHREMQCRLVELAPRGRQVLAPASGHFPQLNEPALVAETIGAVVASSRVAPMD